jgi:Cu+-exporting ATPase
MEKVQWKVEGMDCTTCALNIHKYLEKQGMKNVKVNFATGDVIFEANGNFVKEKISSGIEGLGYSVVNEEENSVAKKTKKPVFPSTHL